MNAATRLLVTLTCLALTPGVALALEDGAAEGAQDATVAAPDAHRAVFENEHVRVIHALAAPGHRSPWHSHPPLVILSTSTGRVRMTYPDGSSEILDVHPGTVIWSDGGVHSWELLAGEIDIYAVEIKSAAKAAEAATE